MNILEAYTRVFVDPDKFDSTVTFYERLTQGHSRFRTNYPEVHLQIADVTSPHATFLIIAGTPEARKSFDFIPLTLRVDDIQATIRELDGLGAEQMTKETVGPTGINVHYRHPDGLAVEYVEQQEEKLKKVLVPSSKRE
jgi:hypothetical protein